MLDQDTIKVLQGAVPRVLYLISLVPEVGFTDGSISWNGAIIEFIGKEVDGKVAENDQGQ